MEKNYLFESRLWLPASQEEVFDFFGKAENLQRITPPWLNFEILTPLPIAIRQGTMIDYRLKLFGIPMRWQTEISVWDPPQCFVDRQIRGPYRTWVHTHRFESKDGGTLMTDQVEYLPRGGLLAPLINRLFVSRNVGRIFDSRREEIRRIFEEKGDTLTRIHLPESSSCKKKTWND